jgi:hypothetical protein
VQVVLKRADPNEEAGLFGHTEESSVLDRR